MKQRFTDEQIIQMIKEQEAGPLGGNQNISRNSITLTFVIALKAFDKFRHLSIHVSL